MTWGVLRRTLGTVTTDLRTFTWAKLHPVAGLRPSDHLAPWSPSASFDVSLPADAPADLLCPRALVERYERDAWDGIKDLAVVVSIAIDAPSHLVATWSEVKAFAADSFVKKRSMAVLSVLHVPARSGVRRPAHVHLIAPARELSSDGFGAFMRPFATDAGAVELAAEWRAFQTRVAASTRIA